MALDDSYSKVLLHFNGDDASPTFTDESGKTWTAAGDAQIDGDQKKFGSGSGQFDGTGDYISTSDHADFDLSGNVPFTIDCWLYLTSWPSANTGWGLFTQYADGNNKFGIELFNNSGTAILNVFMGVYTRSVNPFTFPQNAWTHLAVIYDGTRLWAAVNGVQAGADIEYFAIPDIAADVQIAAYNGGSFLTGRIDEFRFSKGVARWSGTFTPKTAEYLPGNIEAALPIPISFSSTLRSTLYIEAPLAIPVFLSGTMIPVSLVRSTLPVSIGMAGTAWAMQFFDIPGLEQSLPALTLVAELYDSATGTADISIPLYLLRGGGEPADIGELSYRVPLFVVAATGNVSSEAEASVSIPLFTFGTDILIGEVGVALLTLPVQVLTIAAYQGAFGDVSVILPALRVLVSVAPTTAQYETMALNLKNRALSLYTNYPFNSLCYFNGVPLGATSSAIYDLNSGTTDATALMSWQFKTPFLDLEMKTKKRLRQAWLSYKADGDILVTLSFPNGEEYEYSLDPIDDVDHGGRVKFGKGIKSKYVAMEFSGEGAFELEALRLHVDQLPKAR